MRYLIRKIAVPAVLLALTAGCGSSGHRVAGNAAPHTSFSVPAQPANPVPILKETGAKVPHSEVYGDHDVFGNRMAEGEFHGPGCWGGCGEQVTVFTTTNLQRAKAEAPGDFTVDDGDAVVIGKGFWIEVSGVADVETNRITFYVKPSVIAKRVHGHLLAAR